MEEERADALEMAAQAHEERKAPPIEEVKLQIFLSILITYYDAAVSHTPIR